MNHKIILKTLILTALFLAVVRVIVSNLISTSGVELSKINEGIAFIRVQNDSLREDLFSKASFENIASEAARLGFTDKKESFILTSPLPIAAR